MYNKLPWFVSALNSDTNSTAYIMLILINIVEYNRPHACLRYLFRYSSDTNHSTAASYRILYIYTLDLHV